MADTPQEPERQINIHIEPEKMAGHYANFANVSHSDYEFTLTFARVDHEVEDDVIPGVVVSRINLSARFMRELDENWATMNSLAVAHYVHNGQTHKAALNG